MTAIEMMEILRREYGINSYKEFEERIGSAGIDIGVFTEPIPKRKETDHEKEISKICG